MQYYQRENPFNRKIAVFNPRSKAPQQQQLDIKYNSPRYATSESKQQNRSSNNYNNNKIKQNQTNLHYNLDSTKQNMITLQTQKNSPFSRPILLVDIRNNRDENRKKYHSHYNANNQHLDQQIGYNKNNYFNLVNHKSTNQNKINDKSGISQKSTNNYFSHFQNGLKLNRDSYSTTVFPLTSYQSRLMLKQLDEQKHRKQKQQAQRYKLKHYGPDALRYSSYSISPTLFNYQDTNQTQYNSIYKHKLDQNDTKYSKKHNKISSEFSPYHQKNYINKARKPKEQDSSRKYSVYQTKNEQQEMNANQDYYNKEKHKRNLYQREGAHFNAEQKRSEMQKNWSFDELPSRKNFQFDKQYREPQNNTAKNNQLNRIISFNQKQTDLFNKQGSNKSIQSDGSNFVSVNKNTQSNQMLRHMSYGSYGQDLQNERFNETDNHRKQNKFYDSDYINQNQVDIEHKSKGGPLNAMKFSSSSFSSSSGQRRYKPSRFGGKENSQNKQYPNKIKYEGRQYLKIDLIFS